MPAIAPFRAVGAHPAHPDRRDARPAYYLVESAPSPTRPPTRGFLALLARAGAPELPPDVGEGPVVLRYEDPRGWVEELLTSNAFDEVARLQEPDGPQTVWRVDRAEAVGEITAQFEDRALAILRTPAIASVQQGSHPAWVLAFLVRSDARIPGKPGGTLRASPDEPTPQPWTAQAGPSGPAQWRPPPL